MRGAGIQAGSEITEVERDLAATSVNERPLAFKSGLKLRK